MKSIARIFQFCLLSTILCLASSCGFYSFGPGGNLDPGVKTVTISYFPNKARTVAPILSQVFTEMMQDKFQNETGLDLVKEEGDMEFTGAITEYRVTPVAASGDDAANLNRLTIGVRAEYINRVTEEEWTQTFSRFEDFEQSQNLKDVEDELIVVISQQLVDDIFNKTLLNW